MKTLLKTLIILLLYLSVSSLYGAWKTGNYLITAWKASQRIEQFRPGQAITAQIVTDSQEDSLFTGYVCGVADSLWNLSYPTGVTIGQLCAIVGKYLEEHPEKLHLSGSLLVISAFNEAFPSKK